MKTFKTLLLGLTLALMIATPVLAQDDDEVEWVEYETVSGAVTISHPADWLISDLNQQEEVLLIVLISFANNENLLERIIDADFEMHPGDKGGFILGMPEAFMSAFGFDMDDDSLTPRTIAAGFVELFLQDDESVDWDYGEPDTIQLLDQPVIGFVPVTNAEANIEGIFYYYRHDGFVVIGIIQAYTDEYDEAFQEIAVDMVLSFESSISAEEAIEGLSID